jgi:hypothetical protein
VPDVPPVVRACSRPSDRECPCPPRCGCCTVTARLSSCGDECAEGHTYTGRCELAPDTPRGQRSELIDSAAARPPDSLRQREGVPARAFLRRLLDAVTHHGPGYDAAIADLNDGVNQAWSEVRARDRRIAELEREARQLHDCQTAEAAIARVRKLHQPDPDVRAGWKSDANPAAYGRIAQACAQCGAVDLAVRWPCPTIRALDEPTELGTREANANETGPGVGTGTALDQTPED